MNKQNNFIMVNIPARRKDVNIWVSTRHIVFIESSGVDHTTIIHVTEGTSLKRYEVFMRMNELLNLVNNLTEPRKWE